MTYALGITLRPPQVSSVSLYSGQGRITSLTRIPRPCHLREMNEVYGIRVLIRGRKYFGTIYQKRPLFKFAKQLCAYKRNQDSDVLRKTGKVNIVATLDNHKNLLELWSVHNWKAKFNVLF